MYAFCLSHTLTCLFLCLFVTYPRVYYSLSHLPPFISHFLSLISPLSHTSLSSLSSPRRSPWPVLNILRTPMVQVRTVVLCIALYCVVLYCIALYCIVLYCIVLYCIVLLCIVLLCASVLHYTVLYCIALYYTILYNTALYCTVLRSTVSYRTAVYKSLFVLKKIVRLYGVVIRADSDSAIQSLYKYGVYVLQCVYV